MTEQSGQFLARVLDGWEQITLDGARPAAVYIRREDKDRLPDNGGRFRGTPIITLSGEQVYHLGGQVICRVEDEERLESACKDSGLDLRFISLAPGGFFMLAVPGRGVGRCG